MVLSFDEQLALVQGKILHVNFADRFARYRDGLMYYCNRAEELYRGAQIMHEAHGPEDVFALLAGLSIELLLKGIHRALEKPPRHHHRLDDLCGEAGISINDNDKIILQALSEHVAWASKYPTPTKPKAMLKAMQVFDKQLRKPGNIVDYYIPEREISWANYIRLWERFSTYYQTAREARRESAEFWPSGDH
jgi:HEPN domain-containing protein